MILALILAAQPNTTLICSEVCTITAISSTTAMLNFGGCQTNIGNPKLPLSVNYGPPNLALCAYDPMPGVIKSIVAIQQATPYTVTYTKAGGGSTTVVVPALPPTPPVVKNCTGTITIDSTGNEVLSLSCN